jgi:hypothetical protein
MVIKRVGVWSLSKLSFALYAVIGLIIGLIIAGVSALAGAAGAMAGAESGVPNWIAPIFGIGAVVILPIFYGVLGLVVGAIAGVLYNLVAKLVGGLEIDVA